MLEKQEFSLHPKPEFALGPGDKLQVTVWGYPELSSEVVILPDGMVSYPLVGLIPAGGEFRFWVKGEFLLFEHT